MMGDRICILRTPKGYELFRKDAETVDTIVLTALAGGRTIRTTPWDLPKMAVSMEELERLTGVTKEEHMEDMER